jgi:hypothetical protein
MDLVLVLVLASCEPFFSFTFLLIELI